MLRRQDWYVEVSRGKKLSWSSGVFFDPNGIDVCVMDPDVVKHVLKDNSSNYTKPPSKRDFIWTHLRTWLGTGIFQARHGPDAEDGGKEWMRQRKVAAGIFTRANFNTNMSEVFVKKARRGASATCSRHLRRRASLPTC